MVTMLKFPRIAKADDINMFSLAELVHCLIKSQIDLYRRTSDQDYLMLEICQTHKFFILLKDYINNLDYMSFRPEEIFTQTTNFFDANGIESIYDIDDNIIQLFKLQVLR